MAAANPPVKILIAILGMDQHEVGALAVAAMLRDAGMEVIYAGRFNLPPDVINSAIQEDVDVIGISAHSWEYLHFMDDIFAGLETAGVDIPVIVGGSVVTEKDKTEVLTKGVAAAFGPTDTTDEIIADIRNVAEAYRAGEGG